MSSVKTTKRCGGAAKPTSGATHKSVGAPMAGNGPAKMQWAPRGK